MKRTYNFGPEQVESLNRVAGEMHIDKTDVLTNGLRIVRRALNAARRGGELKIVYPDGNSETLTGPWNDLSPAGAA